MKLTNRRQLVLAEGVLLEPNPGDNRIILWLAGSCEGGFQHWERISTVPVAPIAVAGEMCAVPATALRARQRLRSLLGKLWQSFQKDPQEQSWLLPNGESAEQCGERQEDILLVWSETETSLLDEARIQAGRQTVTIDALGNRTTTLFDAAGNTTTVIDANSNETQYLYDADERQTVTIDALGNRTTMLLDAVGNTTAVIDGNSNETDYVYDALNRQTVKVDALGNATTTLYDAVGNTTAVIDPDSYETTFTYDADERQVTKTDPLGNVTTTTYDAVGLVSSVTAGTGRTIDYSYDADNRLTGEVWLAADGVTVEDRLTFSYDPVGHMLTASNSSGTNTFTYDALGRVTEAQEPTGVTLDYGYDAVGNRTSLSDSFGGVTSYTYDAANRLTSTTFSGTGMTPFRVDQTWTPVGQLATVKRYSDLAGTTLVGETDYTYDNAGNVTDIKNLHGSTTLSEYGYTYDAGNRVSTQTINGTTTSYTYDADNELTGDGTSTYTYDANGNRTMTGYSTGTGNQLLSDGTWTYSYDNAGNMSEKTLGTGLETWYYYYNNQNRLTEVIQTSDGTTEEMTDTYTYDALGNQISQTVTLPPPAGPEEEGSTITTQQVYDGQTLLMDLDGSGNLVTRYFAGNGPDQWVARQDGSGNTYYYLSDNLGSIVGIVSASGNLVDVVSYDAFGNVTAQSDSALTGSIGYAGMWVDAVTGLSSTPGRQDYDPVTGRWMQVDPDGFKAGQANLYGYVGNDVLNAIDPSGLKIYKVEMDAFINGNRMGVKWLPEPLLSSWWFKTDWRNFGGDFELSRIRSWFTIDTDLIGYYNSTGNPNRRPAGDLSVESAAGQSERRYWDGSWIYDVPKTTKVKSWSYVYNNDGILSSSCATTVVTVSAAGNYPYRTSPDIDYQFQFGFDKTRAGTVSLTIGVNHNRFPDYEVRLNGKVVYKYATSGTGPGLWNLAIAPNVDATRKLFDLEKGTPTQI